MSNHLHLVLSLDPALAANWSDADVAARWVLLFPPREDSCAAHDAKRDRLMQGPDATRSAGRSVLAHEMPGRTIGPCGQCRRRLRGPVLGGALQGARLCDERALLAAMAYVDLNPVRPGIAGSLTASDHTSIRHRLAMSAPDDLDRPLRPVVGQATIGIRVGLSLRAYVGLVEWMGRQLRLGKHALAQDAPSALARYDEAGRWAVRVKAMGSGYWRVVGDANDLVEAAERMGQRWLKGIGLARALTGGG